MIKVSQKGKILAFKIANNSVTHLGRNLYNTTPPALAELVANSYDAYAKNVYIDIQDNYIMVADDGKGLDYSELELKYTKIGRRKIKEQPYNELSERKPMGKKGIGKLAAFSLGEKYSVYTKKENCDYWINFSLEFEDMKDSDDDEYTVESNKLDALPDFLKDYGEYKSGFIVIVENLRRKSISSTFESLKTQLSRRFYVLESQTEFNLNINGNPLNLEVNKYYDELQYLVYFGYSEDEINSIFESKNIIKEKYTKNQVVDNYISDNNIKGWIGSVRTPKVLKEEQNDFTNVIVYINGKIADEDILKSKGNARIATQYIVGEIQADFFDDDIMDPITSSRQGLDDSIPEVSNFISQIVLIRNYVIDRWDEIRNAKAVESLPERVKNHKSYKEWLKTLTPSQKKVNNKMISILLPGIDDDKPLEDIEITSMITSIANVVSNVEIAEIEKALEVEDDEGKYLSLINKLMDNVSKVEVIRHSDLIAARLRAIEQLEKLMENPKSSEKVFEDKLAENPWLINPYWNIDQNSAPGSIKLRRQKFFRLIKPDDKMKRNFLDIYIEVAEDDLPIIVELKKNNPVDHAFVSYTDIYTQIDNYRTAIIQSNDDWTTINPLDIKAYFILSEDSGTVGSGNKIVLKDHEIKNLNNMNIKILKYNKLINNAKAMYKEHLRVIRDAKVIPDFNTVETKQTDISD